MSGLGWKCGCKGNRKLWIDKIKAIICNLYSPYSLQSVSNPRCVDWSVLAEFYLCDVLLLVAVVAFHDTFFFVYEVEYCRHRLVVGDAFWIVALHDAFELVRGFNHLLLYYFVVLNDV